MPGWDEILKGTNGDDIINGGGGDDYLQGRAGGDTMDGGAGDDQIHGDDGNDQLRGGQGDDHLNGGAGIDTAYYSGSIKEYTFSVNGDQSFNLSHTGGTGLDGNDWLQHIERLVFPDAIIDLTQNNAPIAYNDTASTNEDVGTYSSGSASVLDNDFDWEGDAMSVTPGTFTGAYGTLVLNADGTYTYTPFASNQAMAQGQSVTDSFTYTVSDGSLSDTGTLSITIAGVNDAPVANNDTGSTSENSTVTINVLANDTDVDNGAVLTVISASAPSGQGTAAVVGNQVQFDPGTDFDYLDTGESTQVAVSYTIADEHGAQSTATVTITVTGLNDPPVANDDTATTNEDDSVSGNVLANDTDVDGETLTVTNAATFIGAYGTLVLAANGSYTYTPGAAAQLLNEGESADDVFTYIASDGTASDTATLTITVTGRGGVPDANDDTATTTEDASVSGNVLTNDTDDEGDPLTVSNPGTYTGTYGTLTLAVDGSYTYVPNAAADGLAAGESAQDVFSYTATDGTGSDTATLTVTVNGTNDPPTIDAGGTDADGTVTELPDGDPDEGTAIHTDSGAVAFDDLDLSDTHSATFTPQGGGYFGTFTLDPVDQSGDSVGWDFTVSDAALESLSEGEVRTQTYTIEIDDGHGGTVTQDVTITINGAGVGTGPQTVWYIDNSAVGSANLGTQADPYTSIAAFNAAQGTLGGPQVGHTVFLLAGTGTYAEPDGINLLNDQTLIGVADGALRPTIVTTAGANHGIELAQDNNVSGVDIGTTTGAGISDGGGTVGTLVIGDVGVGGVRAGQIVDIDQGGLISVQLNDAASTASGGGAIDLAGVAGDFTISGATTIAGVHSGGGVDVTGSSAVVSLTGGGLISTGTAAAINYVGNSGALVLGGGLDIVTTTGIGLNATGGGTVTATGSGNSIASAGGIALNVAGTTIGGSGLTFESISANGGASGIVLNGTGSNGLTVTGTGAAGTGGTILNTTGSGIELINANNVSLTDMTIDGTGSGASSTPFGEDGAADGHGIEMRGGSNLTLSGMQVLNAGDGDNEHGLYLFNVSGTVSVQGSTFADASETLIHVDSNNNSDLTLNVGTVTANTFTHGALLSDLGSFTGNGIVVAGRGGSDYEINVSNNIFNNIKLFGIQVGGDGSWTSTNTNVTIDNNDFLVTVTNAIGDANNRANTVNIQGRGTADIDASITNNLLDGGGGGGIQLGADESSNINAIIQLNTVTNQFDNGILIAVDENASLTVLIDQNTISDTSSDGMLIMNAISPGGVSTLNATITNNSVSNHNTNVGGNAFFGGIVLFGGADAADNTNVDIRDNSVSGNPDPGLYFDFVVDGSFFGDEVLMEGPGNAAVDEASFLAQGNTSDAAPGGQTFIFNVFYNDDTPVPMPVVP